MEEKNITMADMTAKVIQDNQLAGVEEDMIWEMLGKRRSERIKNKSCWCLADFAKRETEKALAAKASLMKERAGYLYRNFIQETRIANIDIDELADKDIKKFIILAAESDRMRKEDWPHFLSIIQLAVKAMAGRKGHSKFENVFFDFRDTEERIRYVKNPYSSGEMQGILEWLDSNTDDMRALAADFWLSGGITTEEIVELQRDSLMNSDGVCASNPTVVKKNKSESYLPLAGRRGRIISDALKLHGGQEGNGFEYIFMINDEGEWKKLPDICVQLKLSHICRSIGIAYRPFTCTDAVLPCTG